MPTLRTPMGARVGDNRADLSARRDGHIAPHVGKAASPMSLKRRADAHPDRPAPPEEPFRSNSSVVAGEPRGVVQDSRRR
jgi:hypothetical protein